MSPLARVPFAQLPNRGDRRWRLVRRIRTCVGKTVALLRGGCGSLKSTSIDCLGLAEDIVLGDGAHVGVALLERGGPSLHLAGSSEPDDLLEGDITESIGAEQLAANTAQGC